MRWSCFLRLATASGNSGIGSVKEFRNKPEFGNVIKLCQNVCQDVECLAKIDGTFSYTVTDILNKLGLMDVNDIMYFDYCKERNVRLITFDKELANADKTGETVMLLETE